MSEKDYFENKKELEKQIKLKDKKISDLEHELIELKEKLYESEHLKTKFLSIINNELKNPVSAVSAISRSALNKTNISRENLDKIFLTIEKETKRFSLQLDNILTASSIEAGENNFYVSFFDAGELMEEVFNFYSDEINEKNLECKKNIQINSFLYGDREKIKLLFKNFIDNCIKFSDKQIHLELKSFSKSLKASFFNDGCEIDNNSQKRLFERFNPLSSGLARIYSGIGLGLCICSSVAEMHKGEISFCSGKNKGTLFEVELPLNNEEEFLEQEKDFDESFIIL